MLLIKVVAQCPVRLIFEIVPLRAVGSDSDPDAHLVMLARG